jgi:hypothetical protein
VLVAGRRLHRGDDLARDAELREVAERRLAVGPEVADRLVEADQALLDQVLAVAPDEEVGGRLEAHERGVAPNEAVVGVMASLPGEGEEVAILDLDLSLSLRWGQSGHEHTLPEPANWALSVVAHTSPGAYLSNVEGHR